MTSDQTKLQHRRYTQLAEGLRAERAEGKPARIVGYGAVFYRGGDPETEYWLWDDLVERIMPGCFDRALREDDCRSLFNHDSNLVLGRNKAGTLRLTVDDRGLLYDVTPPDTQLARDQVLAPIERKDVTGSSFMFTTRKVVWIEEKRGDKTVFVRELHDVELWEVGPVVFPAYEGTTTGLRASDPAEARKELEAWRRSQQAAAAAKGSEPDRVDVAYRDFQRREREAAAS